MTAVGQTLDGRYRIVELLGGGGFGQTYIAENTRIPGNPRCVVKQLKPCSNDPNLFATVKRLFDSEAEILSRLGNHDRIPRIIDFFDENQEFYLVQELIEGHPLGKELTFGKKLSESYVIALLKDLLPTLEFIHQQNVIHRDIKPDNIIRRKHDGKLVLIDFGAVKELQSVNTTVAGATVAIGTPGYMPTEQGRGKPRPSSDIYALGIICIQALTGRSPMELTEDPDTGDVIWRDFADVSPGLAAIIDKMVRYHFKERYQTASQVLEALQQFENPNNIPPYNYQPQNPPIPVNPQYNPTVPVNPAPYPQPDRTIPVYQPVSPPPPATPKRKLPLVPIATIFGLGAIAAAAYLILPQLNQPDPPVVNVVNNDDFAAELLSENCRLVAPTRGENTAKIRKEPVRENPVIQTLTAGDKVVYLGEYSGAITDEQNKFVRIKTEDGTAGWVFRSELQSCNSPVATNNNSPTPKPIVKPSPEPTQTPEPTPIIKPTPTPTPSPEPTLIVEETSTPTPSPTAETTFTEAQAVNLVKNWLNSKAEVFGQSYAEAPLERYTTGSYYQDNLASLEKQRETGEYYEFGTPIVEDIGSFSVSGDRASIILTITETTIRYRGGDPVRNKPTSTRRWELMNVDGQWKISSNPKV